MSKKLDEALEKIENILSVGLKEQVVIDGFTFTINKSLFLEDFATVKKIIKILQKKDIPTKPNGEINDWGCPKCDATLEHKYPHCPLCGQSLDWYSE